MKEEIKKIVLTGKLEDWGSNWDKTDYHIDGDSVTNTLYDFRNKKVKITIETLED